MRYNLLLYLFLWLFLIAPASHAANLIDWDIEVSVSEDKTTEWVVTMLYDDNITRSDYFVMSEMITGLEVVTDDYFIECRISNPGLGTSILCDDIWAQKIQYRFRAHSLIESIDSLNIFRYRFSLTQNTDNFSVMIKLPLGAGIVEEYRLTGTGLKSFEPKWGKEGSDGRRILLEWEKDNPILGDVVNVSVVYEQIMESSYLIYFVAIFIVLAIVGFYMAMFRKRNIKDVLPVLTNGERKVMEILLRENKDVDQRKIVKEADFSKAKVSRIIQDLIERDLIEKTHKGRTNLIKLKKVKKPQK